MKTFDCSFLCLLQLLSQRVSAQWTSDSKLAATGSSVPFPGTDREFNNLNWDFSDSSRNLPITEVHKGKLIIFEKYKNRIKVDISDGSFELKDVRKADSGHYKITVNLDPQRTRILTLEIIDPLSTPSISSEYNPGTHVAVLNCTVQRGRATSVLWIREGVVLPVTPRQSLSDGNVTFTIWNAEGSDSGYYTCSVENQVSRTNSTYQLIIKGYDSHPRAWVGLYLSIFVVITSVLVFSALLVHAETAFWNKRSTTTDCDMSDRHIETSPSPRSSPVPQCPNVGPHRYTISTSGMRPWNYLASYTVKRASP